jgi:hypothetical protein
MKNIFYFTIITLICLSCGDSLSDYSYIIDNKTEYDIILCISEHTPNGQDSILCLPNTETLIFKGEFSSVKKLSCTLPPITEDIKIVVDEGKKHLTKEFSDINNWKCTGEEDWDLIMVGSYYSSIKSTFVITEDDLE